MCVLKSRDGPRKIENGEKSRAGPRKIENGGKSRDAPRNLESAGNSTVIPWSLIEIDRLLNRRCIPEYLNNL